MTEIVAIVEGPTEQTFVRDQLAAHLGSRGTAIWAVLSGKTRKQGGVRKWESARGDIVRTLKEGRYCTTMFDYYAMPADWPGRSQATELAWGQRGTHVETAILRDLSDHIGGGFNPAQFIPYVQVHEFEALVFADIQELARSTAPVSGTSAEHLANEFNAILAAAGNPEAIDDGYDTCPSRRIAGLVRGYRKPLHGPIVAGRIGIGRLRSACRHFADWLARLESL